MRILPLSLVLILFLGLSACATTNRDKILQTMIAAGVAGAIYGVTRDSNPELQGAILPSGDSTLCLTLIGS